MNAYMPGYLVSPMLRMTSMYEEDEEWDDEEDEDEDEDW